MIDWLFCGPIFCPKQPKDQYQTKLFHRKPKLIRLNYRQKELEPKKLYLLGNEISYFLSKKPLFLLDGIHRRRKYERCSPNSLRPISYFGSIWELYVLDLKTKVFCRKKNQIHFSIDKGLTVPK